MLKYHMKISDDRCRDNYLQSRAFFKERHKRKKEEGRKESHTQLIFQMQWIYHFAKDALFYFTLDAHKLTEKHSFETEMYVCPKLVVSKRPILQKVKK